MTSIPHSYETCRCTYNNFKISRFSAPPSYFDETISPLALCTVKYFDETISPPSSSPISIDKMSAPFSPNFLGNTAVGEGEHKQTIGTSKQLTRVNKLSVCTMARHGALRSSEIDRYIDNDGFILSESDVEIGSNHVEEEWRIDGDEEFSDGESDNALSDIDFEEMDLGLNNLCRN
ncbi:hypothetical protein J6590_025317 [Homalodisca vitripennis]|nr:hypothetical protein J6590_025317 [Homalodisca vitripennis]